MIFANAAYIKRKSNEQKLLRQEYGEFMKCSFSITEKVKLFCVFLYKISYVILGCYFCWFLGEL